MKDKILKIIETRGAVKSTELVMALMNRINPSQFDHYKFTDAIADLVLNRLIVEINYTLPNQDGKQDSVYFAKGTRIRLHIFDLK